MKMLVDWDVVRKNKVVIWHLQKFARILNVRIHKVIARNRLNVSSRSINLNYIKFVVVLMAQSHIGP